MDDGSEFHEDDIDADVTLAERVRRRISMSILPPALTPETTTKSHADPPLPSNGVGEGLSVGTYLLNPARFESPIPRSALRIQAMSGMFA